MRHFLRRLQHADDRHRRQAERRRDRAPEFRPGAREEGAAAPPRPGQCANPQSGPIVAARRRAADVGTDKDSGCRRRMAIKVLAAGADYLIIGGHRGAAVSGADPVERYLDLAVMLDCVEVDHVRVAPVEDASRLAPRALADGAGTRRAAEALAQLRQRFKMTISLRSAARRAS